AIALSYAAQGANVALLARSEDKLHHLRDEIRAGAKAKGFDLKVHVYTVDVRNPPAIKETTAQALNDLDIQAFDILINNAGLALGAPAAFWEQDIAGDISTMVQTNVLGFMCAAHAILNEGGMAKTKRGTILNITSVTGLELPPFPGEAVYHATKACQEAFTDSLRNELVGTNVRVLALRPGVVQTNFHEQRVGHDKGRHDDFVGGIEALVAEDVAKAVVWMVNTPERVSVKALDVIPSSQRSLQVFDREWEKRNGKSGS
ncbi:NAD(P)-binding protein, partial [Teratosphaeria nubilosa]